MLPLFLKEEKMNLKKVLNQLFDYFTALPTETKAWILLGVFVLIMIVWLKVVIANADERFEQLIEGGLASSKSKVFDITVRILFSKIIIYRYPVNLSDKDIRAKYHVVENIYGKGLYKHTKDRKKLVLYLEKKS